jgi:hypothetical protein
MLAFTDRTGRSGERHDRRRRVVHEVEQVVEPAARNGHRPTVKLGLHPRYPDERANLGVRTTGIPRRIFWHHSVIPLSQPLPPFPI